MSFNITFFLLWNYSDMELKIHDIEFLCRLNKKKLIKFNKKQRHSINANRIYGD